MQRSSKNMSTENTNTANTAKQLSVEQDVRHIPGINGVTLVHYNEGQFASERFVFNHCSNEPIVQNTLRRRVANVEFSATNAFQHFVIDVPCQKCSQSEFSVSPETGPLNGFQTKDTTVSSFAHLTHSPQAARARALPRPRTFARFSQRLS